jgi:hypothetical protein
MSALWGTQALRTRALLILAALVILLSGCEYTGPEEGPSPAPPQASAGPPSFEDNIKEVARLLEAAPNDPGMPSQSEPAGKLSADLAPGDYKVSSACAGVYGAKVTIVQGGGLPLTSPFSCDAGLERFVRHAGGHITISAVPATGKAAAAGVTVEPNDDPRASTLEDMREWSSQQLKPDLPGQLAAYADSSVGSGLLAQPGNYELHFTCEGPPEAMLSVSTWAGAEVLAPVRVPCNGNVFKAHVRLATEGADFRMNPVSGTEGRYAFRLVPSA